MEFDKIKEKLLPGDAKLIAEMSGYTPVTVRAQIAGRRTLKDKVKEAAELVVTTRENMLSSKN